MASQQAETTYYEQGDIKITSARAVFGSTSYALANITSVAAGIIPASKGFAGLMMLGGFLAVVLGFVMRDNSAACWIGGALMLVFGFLIDRSQKDSYAVKIGTAGAEQRAYTSGDKAEIDKIVAALNDAIVKRG